MRKVAKRVLFGGVIVEFGPGLVCQVRLGSGEQVSARIPHHIARVMFRIVPGDRVAIEQRGTGVFKVIGHERHVIDAVAVAHLTYAGKSVADWFFLGDCPCFWSRHGDIGNWLTSDNWPFSIVEDFLRRHGAPVYESPDEARRARSDRI